MIPRNVLDVALCYLFSPRSIWYSLIIFRRLPKLLTVQRPLPKKLGERVSSLIPRNTHPINAHSIFQINNIQRFSRIVPRLSSRCTFRNNKSACSRGTLAFPEMRSPLPRSSMENVFAIDTYREAFPIERQRGEVTGRLKAGARGTIEQWWIQGVPLRPLKKMDRSNTTDLYYIYFTNNGKSSPFCACFPSARPLQHLGEGPSSLIATRLPLGSG